MLSNIVLVSTIHQHESAISIHMFWRRARQPTPVFLPGESHGQRSLAGCSPRGCKESDSTEHAHTQRSLPSSGYFIYILICLLFLLVFERFFILYYCSTLSFFVFVSFFVPLSIFFSLHCQTPISASNDYFIHIFLIF